MPIAWQAQSSLPRSRGGAPPLTEILLMLTAAISLPVAVYGIVQIIGTTLRQLSGPAEMVDYVAFFTGAQLVRDDPSQLYQLDAWTALQSALHSADLPLLQFWNPPHAALLLAPLGLLPFGVSYAVFLLLNLGCLIAAWRILAPPTASPARAWLIWGVAMVLFLPVQLGLVMGQLCFGLLLGFAVLVLLVRRGAQHWPGLALLPWTLKPQLLPVLILTLLLARRWRALVVACLVPASLTAVIVAQTGPGLLVDYVHLAGWATSGVVTAAGTHLDSGHTVLGLAQWAVGPGALSNVLAIVGALVLWTLVGLTWRSGLHADARQHLQFALLPVAAIVTSPHALAYDAVTWLATAWLLLTYVAARPRARRLVLALLLVGWWAGNLAVLPPTNTIAPWGGFAALVGLAAMLWLYWSDAATSKAVTDRCRE